MTGIRIQIAHLNVFLMFFFLNECICNWLETNIIESKIKKN